MRILYKINLSVLTIIFISNIAFIIAYRNPLFILDDWRSLSHFLSTGLFDSIVCKHNSHPLYIPAIFYRASLLLFDASSMSRIVFNVIFISLNIGMLSLIISTVFRNVLGRLPIFVLCGLLAVVYSSPVNINKLVWGMAIHDHIVFFGVLVSIWGLIHLNQEERLYWPHIVILTGGVIASISFGYGGAVWGALLIGLILLRSRNIMDYGVVFIGALIFILVMMYTPNCGNGKLGIWTKDFNPINSIKFVPLLLGSFFRHLTTLGPLKTVSDIPSYIFGVLGIVSLIAFTLRAIMNKEMAKCYPIIIIAWFCVGATFLVSIGRGFESVIALKFITISLVFWVSIFCLGLYYINRGPIHFLRQRRITSAICATIFLFLVIALSSYQALQFLPRKIHQDFLSLILIAPITSEQFEYSNKKNHKNIPLFVEEGREYLKNNSADIYKEEWAGRMGTIFQPTLDISNKYSCVGELLQVASEGPFLKLGGWVRDINNEPIKYLYIIENSRVIGLAKLSPNRSRVYLHRQIKYMSRIERILFGILPKDVLLLFGMHSNWVGIVSDKRSFQNQEMEYVAERHNGSFCSVKLNNLAELPKK